MDTVQTQGIPLSTVMAQDVQFAARIPQDMADRLKAYAEKLEADFGVPVSVAAAARRLLTEGLDRAGIPKADDSAEEGAA